MHGAILYDATVPRHVKSRLPVDHLRSQDAHDHLQYAWIRGKSDGFKFATTWLTPKAEQSQRRLEPLNCQTGCLTGSLSPMIFSFQITRHLPEPISAVNLLAFAGSLQIPVFLYIVRGAHLLCCPIASSSFSCRVLSGVQCTPSQVSADNVDANRAPAFHAGQHSIHKAARWDC